MSRSNESKIGQTRYAALAWRSLSRFGDLPANVEPLIDAAIDLQEAVPPSYELMAPGDALENPRILLSGWAAHMRLTAGGRRQILGFFVPGDVFGHSSWCGARSLSRIVALTPTRYAQIPYDRDACCCHAQAANRVMFVLGQFQRVREEQLIDQIVRMGMSAYERVAHLLLELYRRLKVVGFVHSGSYDLPLSQETLGDALGLSAVHTNKILQQLRRDGLIETHGMTITLPEIDRLRDMTDFPLSQV